MTKTPARMPFSARRLDDFPPQGRGTRSLNSLKEGPVTGQTGSVEALGEGTRQRGQCASRVSPDSPSSALACEGRAHKPRIGA